jgi:hypothetical protein
MNSIIITENDWKEYSLVINSNQIFLISKFFKSKSNLYLIMKSNFDKCLIKSIHQKNEENREESTLSKI